MLDNDGLQTLAAHARTLYPFYEWLQQQRDVLRVDGIPVFDKRMLFRFSDESGMEYWARNGDARKPKTLFPTTGTTGRVLFVPYDGEPNVASQLARALLRWTSGPIRRTVSSIHTPDYMKLAFASLIHYGIDVAYVTSGDELLDTIGRDDYLLIDLGGTLSRSLFSLGDTPKNPKLVFSMDKFIQRQWRDRGIATLSGYVSADQLLFLSGCSLSGSLVHIESRSCDLHRIRVLEGNRLLDFGTGFYVGTVGYGIFPFINYMNGDIVELRQHICGCGYNGFSLNFLGRNRGIKIGSDGPPMDIDGMYSTIEEKYFHPCLIVASFRVIDGLPSAMVIALVEDARVDNPVLEEEGWKDLMVGGGGVTGGTEHYAPLLQVVRVPRSLFPRGNHKQLTFLDWRESVAASYMPIWRALQRMLNVTCASGGGETSDN